MSNGCRLAGQSVSPCPARPPPRIAVAGAVLAGLWAVAATPALGQSRADRVRSFLENAHEVGRFQGSAVVIDGGDTLFSGGLGHANAAAGLSATAETLYPLGGLHPPAEPPAAGAPKAVAHRRSLTGFRAVRLPSAADEPAADSAWISALDLLARAREAVWPAQPKLQTHGDLTVEVIRAEWGGQGIAAAVRLLPGRDQHIAVIDNAGTDLEPVVEGLTQILLDRLPDQLKPSIGLRILSILQSAGVGPALERYSSWKNTRADDYEFGAAELQLLAEHLLSEELIGAHLPREGGGAPSQAEAVLVWQVENQPGHLASHRLLARILAARGDTLGAAAQLETALTYSPGDARLVQEMQRIGVEPAPFLLVPEAALPPAALLELVGVYGAGIGFAAAEGAPDDGPSIHIEFDGDCGLAVRLDGGPPFPLIAQTPAILFMKGSTTRFVFDSGAADGTWLTVIEGGRRGRFLKFPQPELPAVPGQCADRSGPSPSPPLP